MLDSLKAKIIIAVIFFLISGGITWRVLSWREQAHKVAGLEKEVTSLKDQKQALIDKSVEDQKQAAKRLKDAQLKRENDLTTIVNLRGQLATSPNIIIPADKLQAIRNADISR